MAVLYILLLLLGIVSGKLLQWLKGGNKHDTVPGLPVLGNALALGKHGAAYISACRHKFGDVVTLSFANQKMMFWFEPHLIRQFFEAPDTQISFRPAVEQFTQRVFGLPSKTFFPMHSQVLQDLRGLLEPTSLAEHAAALAVSCNKRLDKLLPHGEQVELYVAIRRLVFGSGVEVLFGSKCLSAGSGQPSELELEAAFHDFEAGFEMAASPIPHIFQPRFVAARNTLLSWLRHCHSEGMFKGTTAGQLYKKSGLPSELAPHLLLAVLWASQANTVAATFWATAFLLLPQQASIKQEVLIELQHVSLSDEKQQPLGVSNDGDTSAQQQQQLGASLSARAAVKALDRRSAASRAVAEAIRLRVQSIDVRMASSDFTITTATGQKVFVNKGCVLAINPYLSHLDSDIYKGVDPAVFDPSRPIMDVGGGSIIVPSLAGLAFGAGFYRCPGRFFAEMEVALFVQLLLSQRSMTLEPRSPVQATESPELTHDNAARTSWTNNTLQWLFGKAAVEWGLGSRLEDPSSGSNSCLLHSGDPDGSLPPPDLKKLVGVKVPSAPCYVHVEPVR